MARTFALLTVGLLLVGCSSKTTEAEPETVEYWNYGGVSKFTVTITVDGRRFDLDGGSLRQVSADGSPTRHIPNWQGEQHKLWLSASHSHSLFAQVDISPVRSDETAPETKFEVDVDVTYTTYRDEETKFKKAGKYTIDSMRQISGNGVVVTIAARPK